MSRNTSHSKNRNRIARQWERIPTITIERKYLVALAIFGTVGFYLMIALVNSGFILWFQDTFPIFKKIREVTHFPLKDKFGHLFSSGIFALVMNLVLRGRTFELFGKSIYLGTFIVFVIITSEEFSQIFFTLRSFDLLDLTFDLVGILLFGNLAYPWVNQKLQFKESPSKART